MINAVWDSFCRALIRFFDNQFIKESPVRFYELEIGRLHQQINLLISPRTVIAEAVEEIEMKPAMNPIETSWQKRARLENESRIEWNKQIEAARLKIQSSASQEKQTTEELEKSVGVS